MKRAKNARHGTPTLRFNYAFGGRSVVLIDLFKEVTAPNGAAGLQYFFSPETGRFHMKRTIELLCTVCNNPVEDVARGHAAWWGGLPETCGAVRGFEVLCSAACVRVAGAKHALPGRAAGLQFSWPLHWCMGPARAVWFMQEVTWIYQWERSSEPLRKMLDFIIVAAQQPAPVVPGAPQYDRPPILGAFSLQPVGGAS